MMPARRRNANEPDLLTEQERAYGRARLAEMKAMLTAPAAHAEAAAAADTDFLDSPDRVPEE